MGEIQLLPMEFLEQTADCLKVMSHPARLRIVEILMQGEYPVHQIASLCGLNPNQTCEHLRLMKGYGYLDSERRGRFVFYSIANPQLPSLLQCIRSACDQSTKKFRTKTKIG